MTVVVLKTGLFSMGVSAGKITSTSQWKEVGEVRLKLV